MTQNRLNYINKYRRSRGRPILSGNKWGLTNAPQVGPIQANILKVVVYKIKRYLKKREERLANLYATGKYSKQGLWVQARKERRKILDLRFSVDSDETYSLRELQSVGKDATEYQRKLMKSWLNVIARYQ